MSKLLLLITYIIISVPSLHAQKEAPFNINDQGAFSPKFYLSKGQVVNSDTSTYILSSKTRISPMYEVGDSLFFKISGSTVTDQRSYINIDPWSRATVRFSDWDTHLLTIPIKIRPGQQDASLQFSGEMSLGSYVGYQMGTLNISDEGIRTISSTVAVFAGPSMINIDPTVADTNDSNPILGFSFGGGWIANLSKVQVAIVGGIDYVGGDASKTWIYQGKPWVSFALGFDFNDEEK